MWIGLVLTLAYIGFLSWLAWGRWHEFSNLKLNEQGDVLAGAFGPLAVAWLVLGFFQQGEELQQNTKALTLQIKELEGAVEQQRLMVQASKEATLAAERPYLSVSAKVASSFEPSNLGMNLEVVFTVKNHGRAPAERVLLRSVMFSNSRPDDFDRAWATINNAEEFVRQDVKAGFYVDPGQSKDIPWVCWVPADEWKKGIEYANNTHGRMLPVMLLGRVEYHSWLGAKHSSPFVNEVKDYDQNNDAAFQLPGQEYELAQSVLWLAEVHEGREAST